MSKYSSILRGFPAPRLILSALCIGVVCQGLAAQSRSPSAGDRDLVDELVIKGTSSQQGSTASPGLNGSGSGSRDNQSLDAGNTLLISEPLGRERFHLPVQIGRPFARGEYQESVQVSLAGQRLPTQVDIKNRWPDGSLRFAVLSFVVPQLSAGSSAKLSIEAAATQPTLAPAAAEVQRSLAAQDAVLELSQAGRSLRTSLQKALSQVTPMVWTQGPINTTWILADHSAQRTLDLGFTAARSLRPIFQVTVWHQLGLVKTRVILENANTTTLEDSAYDVRIRSRSATQETIVFSRPGVTHHTATRWTKSFWLGGVAPEPVSIKHNVAYLARVGAIPNFDPQWRMSDADISAQYSRWQGTARGLYEAGFWTKSMPAPGGRDDIAIFPNWAIEALITGDWRQHEISEEHAAMAGAWPMHFREGASGKFYDQARKLPALGAPVSLFARPSLWIGTENRFYKGDFIKPEDRLVFTGKDSSGDWTPDGSHQPSPYYLQYLFSGDFWHLEQMQFWAAWGTLFSSIDLKSGFYGRGPSLTSAAFTGDIRTQAWVMRNRAVAAAFSPDGTKEKAYFEVLMINGIAIAEAARNIPDSPYKGSADWQWGSTVGREGFYPGTGIHPLHMWDSGGEAFALQQNSLYREPAARGFAPFQMGYILIALDFSHQLGFPTQRLLSWAAGFITEATRAPDTAPLIGMFVIPAVKAQPRANLASWPAVLEMFKDPGHPSAFVEQWLNSPDGMPLIMTAAASTITREPGGAAAWQWIKRNWVERRRVPVPARWAIVPRTP